MARKPRELLDNGYYHVIARGNNRRQVFHSPEDYLFFKTLIIRSKKSYKWKLHHYCLMPNHIHFLVNIETALELQKIMKFILQTYSGYYRNKTDYVGYLWQGRFKSPLIQKESYLLECGRYIERNPVRAGIVQSPGKYPWSSYNFYAQSVEDPLIDESPYYALLASLINERKLRYMDFVGMELPYDKLLDEALLDSCF